MPLRLIVAAWLVALATGSTALAQSKVRTETIRPPEAGPAAPAKPDAATPKPAEPAQPEIITDLSLLPEPVARLRERLLAAARSGDLQQLATVMQESGNTAMFSFSEDRDPVAFWKSSYPDSDGIEVLAILSEILEAGYIRSEAGTPQEMFIWPYFARMPLKSLTPQQKVELFRIVTGSDYKEMIDFGAYIFYRLGIGPDGTWHYFVAGD